MRAPVVLFLVTLVTRLAYIFATKTYLVSGSAEIENAAISLVQNGILGNVYGTPSGPSAHAAPVYPLLLAAVYSLVGLDSPYRKLAQQLFGALITAGGAAALPWASRRLRLGQAGLVAGTLLALSPLHLWIETSGAWEQPLSALALILCTAFTVSLEDRGWTTKATAAWGVGVGVLALLSPPLLFAALLMLGVSLVAERSRNSLRRAAIALVFMGLPILPWAIRNLFSLGELVLLRSNVGLELYIGNNDEADGRSYAGDWDNANTFFGRHHPFMVPAERAHLTEVGEVAYMREKQELAKRWILDHPQRFLLLTMKRAQLYFFPTPSLWPGGAAAKTAKALALSLLSLLACVSLLPLARDGLVRPAMLAAALVGPALPYLVSHIDARYRYPTHHLMLLLGAWFVVTIVARRTAASRAAAP